jgi:predicted DCC family thiol-disulfide oxidoreductase YuxK
VATVGRDVPWIIYDGDCAFCTFSANWLARRLHRRRGPNARLVPWQFIDLAALGTTAERTQREALWVSPEGTIYGGAAAFAQWLKFRASRRCLRPDREEPAPDAGWIAGLRAPSAWL